MQDHVAERHRVGGRLVPHGVQAEHHHPRDPEEQDVVPGDQHAGRVEGPQVRGFLGPAEGGEGPQRRGEPGVEDVGVLGPALRGLLVRANAAHRPVRPVENWNTVAPPQLTGDAPVVHVVDPAEVPGVHLGRVQPDAAVAHGVAGRLGQRRDADEPLQRLPRLDRGAAAAAVPDGVQVGPDLGHDPAVLPQRVDHRGTGLEAVQALERAVRGDHAVLVHDGQAGQVVTAADLEVVGVVRRGDLDRASAELGVDVIVGDDRDMAAGQRQLHSAAEEMGVARVVGVHGHRGVAQHGLGAGGRDHDGVRAVAVADGGELALVIAVVDLDVAQRGQAARAPVDDPLGPVDQAVVVKLLEDRLHGAGQARVHGEALAGPVDAVAQAAHLAQDPAAGFGLPLPDPLDEGLAAEVVPAQALLGQLALDHVLGGDAGVVHAGHPQGVVALHAAAADQRVNQRVVEGVTDVQGAGDVRRGDDDAERGRTALRVGGKIPRLLPAFVAGAFDLGRRVLGGQLDWGWSAHDR